MMKKTYHQVEKEYIPQLGQLYIKIRRVPIIANDTVLTTLNPVRLLVGYLDTKLL